MAQIVDLEKSPGFEAMGVQLVSIARDPLPQLDQAAKEWRTKTPLLSDVDGEVSRSYGVLRWATPAGEPGHTFVLVGADGGVNWIQDYGAAENGGRMYVPVEELVQEIGRALRSQPQ